MSKHHNFKNVGTFEERTMAYVNETLRDYDSRVSMDDIDILCVRTITGYFDTRPESAFNEVLASLERHGTLRLF